MAALTPAVAPFTRKRVGAHYVWAADLEIALAVAKDQSVELFLTDAPHQVAKLIGAGVKLVLYPHKTSANNYHLRVRDEGSADKAKAGAVMSALDVAAGNNCTFSQHMNLRAPLLRVQS